jgi:carboxymethylenebutenolidase
MKKQYLFPTVAVLAPAFLALLLLPRAEKPAEPAMPMCHGAAAAAQDFAAFADDAEFRAAHPSPAPAALVHGGRMVEFPVEGGANGRGFLMNAHRRTNKYLLVFHEWWGLNDHIKQEVAMWSHQLDINVLALDLYDGQLAANAEEAGNLMKANDPARSRAIIEGAVKAIGEGADYRTIGWCFGGGWSLQAALLLKDKAKGCVIYYGMPEKDVEKLKTLQTDVLFVHASQDQWINDQLVDEFSANMKTAGKQLSVHRYDANHAFANPSSPRYNEEAARQSRMVVAAYLSKT